MTILLLSTILLLTCFLWGRYQYRRGLHHGASYAARLINAGIQSTLADYRGKVSEQAAKQ